MRTLTLFSFIAISLLSSCSSSTILQSYFGEEKLTGKIKSIHEIQYEAEEKFGEIIPVEKTEVIFYGTDLIYDFTSDGNMISQTILEADSSIQMKEVHKYDTKNRKTVTHQYDSDGELQGQVNFEYNKANKLTKMLSYDRNGKLHSYTQISYDQKGTILESSTFIENGQLLSKANYVPGKRGKIKECKITIYERSKEEKASNIMTWKYGDDNRLIIQENHDLNSDTKSDYRAEYLALDQNKNWTKANIYVDGVIKFVRLREIAYY